ncbi:MAG: DNA repair exonuclease [Pseudanabaenaceae cyanobacterium bins.68]|nr:DNA repair exonuclease [Pseudanabaenaceae cyanobacterium bins.68]
MKLVHLADLHLGYRAYHRLSKAGINRRELDVFAAFREALNLIVELQPDLVLLAGDIFDLPRPSNFALVEAQRLLLDFRSRCGADLVAIAGNHESVRSSGNRCVLELLQVIPGLQVVVDRPEVVEISSKGLKITCLPHNALATDQMVAVAPQPQAAFNLLMLHGTVDSDRINDFGGYDVPGKILAMDWDYVACGHFHSFTHLGGNAYYAGAIERTSNDIWKEANEPKGLIEFDLNTHKAKFHALKSPRPTLDLPAIDARDLTIAELNQAIARQAETGEIKDKIVRQQILNLPKPVKTQLDHQAIRHYQTMALHYLLDARPAPGLISATILPGRTLPSHALADQAADFFSQRSLPPDLKSATFISKALSYLQAHPSHHA